MYEQMIICFDVEIPYTRVIIIHRLDDGVPTAHDLIYRRKLSVEDFC